MLLSSFFSSDVLPEDLRRLSSIFYSRESYLILSASFDGLEWVQMVSFVVGVASVKFTLNDDFHCASNQWRKPIT